MAFNQYGYQNPYYPAQMPNNFMQYRQNQMMSTQPVAQNPIAQGGVQWVNSEMEARSWMIAPNSAVTLWDSTSPTVYLKKADASGKPFLTIYDLVERTTTPSDAPLNQVSNYVTREEFDALAAAVCELKGKKDVKEESTNE